MERRGLYVEEGVSQWRKDVVGGGKGFVSGGKGFVCGGKGFVSGGKR